MGGYALAAASQHRSSPAVLLPIRAQNAPSRKALTAGGETGGAELGKLGFEFNLMKSQNTGFTERDNASHISLLVPAAPGCEVPGLLTTHKPLSLSTSGLWCIKKTCRSSAMLQDSSVSGPREWMPLSLASVTRAGVITDNASI